MYTVQIPNLPTLVKPPSWCNSHGNVDRAACVEIRMSNVRRLAGCVRHRNRVKGWGPRKRIGVEPLPAQMLARTSAGRLSTGVYFIDADEVLHLFGLQLPRRLAGDFRTNRAPAMRDENWKPFHNAIDLRGLAPMVGRKTKRPQRPRAAKGFRARYSIRRNADPRVMTWMDSNPNKGAARSKMLGIYSDWFQPLRLEKWRHTEVGPRYWLICPGNPSKDGSLRRGEVGAGERAICTYDAFSYAALSSAERWKLARGDCRFPPLSNAGPGLKRKSCPQRVLKLFLVMCTKGEMRDAEVAHKWMQSLPPRVYAQRLPLIGRLWERYGMIFQPRTLLCAKCLGLHYANHPDTNRMQYWQRKGMAMPGEMNVAARLTSRAR